ncbi:hypothetical protein VNO77_25144 [Canavalia gladiata]|uniref:Uncharacterized protein n=1 Tax=Canavalia gladiata TaxID=3824 RepID=A0AAN9LCS1_CANGL
MSVQQSSTIYERYRLIVAINWHPGKCVINGLLQMLLPQCTLTLTHLLLTFFYFFTIPSSTLQNSTLSSRRSYPSTCPPSSPSSKPTRLWAHSGLNIHEFQLPLTVPNNQNAGV